MRVKWYGKQVEMRVHSQAADLVEKVALMGEAETKRILKRRSYPPASQPGQPPAQRSARLDISIAHEVDRMQLLSRFGTNVMYGLFLELGTSKMEARPFLRPVLDWLRGQFK